MKLRRWMLHALRVSMFLSVIALIHLQYARLPRGDQAVQLVDIPLVEVQSIIPLAAELRTGADNAFLEIIDEEENVVGHALQTSPQADHLIGFSGPTNTLVVFDAEEKIVGLKILSSGDTREHVRHVEQDEKFWNSFQGLTAKQASTVPIDAVSGATLTSLAIRESIATRLTGSTASFRFPDPPSVSLVQKLIPQAASIVRSDESQSLWHVLDATGAELGSLLRTTPAADNITGFQGPTESLLFVGSDGKTAGLRIGKTYDNEDYVKDIRNEEYFLSLFDELTMAELADLDLEEAEVEGVSGATMTSMAVAEGLLLAAQRYLKDQSQHDSQPATKQESKGWKARDWGTGIVVALGLLIANTSLRGNRWIRIGFQCVLIGYLGLINGDLLSQAMLVGWAQRGVPWTRAGGLVVLSIAALVTPIAFGRNNYCTHLCPHGAAQGLLRNRLGWKLRLSGRWQRILKLLPAVLLGWCVLVAMAGLSFSLVDIEPFDAWIFRIAGWATLTVAIVGLAFSAVVPMGYCRYGCPTGALLGFLRKNAKSDQWSRRDWVALALLLLALMLWLTQ